ncbi:MAG: hypothetical protein QGI79_00630, partial [Dehalococcoidia bacterium]|nr:hypothetical protein [Dehalococcoidia bacterium]
MTEVATLIERVRTLGATLLVHGDTVKVKAPAPLPAVVIEALRQHKQEVMALLQAPPAMPPIPPPPDNPV